MLDQLRNDPMVAGSIWRLLLFVFALVLWLALRSEESDHEWWGETMVKFKLSGDPYSAVDSSRTLFKWLTIVMLLVNLWHAGNLVYRRHPAFAKTVQTDTSQPSALPEGYGAGGGGRMVPGRDAPAGGAPAGGGGRLGGLELDE